MMCELIPLVMEHTFPSSLGELQLLRQVFSVTWEEAPVYTGKVGAAVCWEAPLRRCSRPAVRRLLRSPRSCCPWAPKPEVTCPPSLFLCT